MAPHSAKRGPKPSSLKMKCEKEKLIQSRKIERFVNTSARKGEERVLFVPELWDSRRNWKWLLEEPRGWPSVWAQGSMSYGSLLSLVEVLGSRTTCRFYWGFSCRTALPESIVDTLTCVLQEMQELKAYLRSQVTEKGNFHHVIQPSRTPLQLEKHVTAVVNCYKIF